MYFCLKYFLKVVPGSRIMSSICYNFKLSQYDVVGLDFDNTLVQYNLSNLFRLHYSYLVSYLVEKKGYLGMCTTMNDNDVDFIRKGLFMDFNRGNILNISATGTIIRASHGTKKLSVENIIKIYGPEKRWPPLDTFIEEKVIKTTNCQTYSFLDFTDCAAILVYAKAVDLIDERSSSEYEPVWTHLLEAIIDMYKLDSEFISTVGKNISQYVHRCDEQVIEWLKKLKENCKLLLVTSAEPATVNYLAKYCLGADWEGLFHMIVDSAEKPHFFSGKNSFRDLMNKEIELNTSRGRYRRGNWIDLHRILTEELGRPAKCVYLGDNVVQDIYAPSASCSPTLDTVSIMEESLAEGYFPGVHPYSEYIRSDFWGPYFEQKGIPTLMGDIVMKHSKLCIPLLKYLVDKPLDYQHIPFWTRFKSNETFIKAENI